MVIPVLGSPSPPQLVCADLHLTCWMGRSTPRATSRHQWEKMGKSPFLTNLMNFQLFYHVLSHSLGGYTPIFTHTDVQCPEAVPQCQRSVHLDPKADSTPAVRSSELFNCRRARSKGGSEEVSSTDVDSPRTSFSIPKTRDAWNVIICH